MKYNESELLQSQEIFDFVADRIELIVEIKKDMRLDKDERVVKGFNNYSHNIEIDKNKISYKTIFGFLEYMKIEYFTCEEHELKQMIIKEFIEDEEEKRENEELT